MAAAYCSALYPPHPRARPTTVSTLRLDHGRSDDSEAGAAGALGGSFASKGRVATPYENGYDSLGNRVPRERQIFHSKARVTGTHNRPFQGFTPRDHLARPGDEYHSEYRRSINRSGSVTSRSTSVPSSREPRRSLKGSSTERPKSAASSIYTTTGAASFVHPLATMDTLAARAGMDDVTATFTGPSAGRKNTMLAFSDTSIGVEFARPSSPSGSKPPSREGLRSSLGRNGSLPDMPVVKQTRLVWNVTEFGTLGHLEEPSSRNEKPPRIISATSFVTTKQISFTDPGTD